MGVLVVDDHKDFRVLLRARIGLRHPSLAFHEAESGVEASIQLHRHPIDLVISDFEMKNGTGFWLYHFMREYFPKTPLIIFTANPTGFPATTDQTLRAIISKYNMKDLLKEIDKHRSNDTWDRLPF